RDAAVLGGGHRAPRRDSGSSMVREREGVSMARTGPFWPQGLGTGLLSETSATGPSFRSFASNFSSSTGDICFGCESAVFVNVFAGVADVADSAPVSGSCGEESGET